MVVVIVILLIVILPTFYAMYNIRAENRERNQKILTNIELEKIALEHRLSLSCKWTQLQLQTADIPSGFPGWQTNTMLDHSLRQQA